MSNSKTLKMVLGILAPALSCKRAVKLAHASLVLVAVAQACLMGQPTVYRNNEELGLGRIARPQRVVLQRLRERENTRRNKQVNSSGGRRGRRSVLI